MHRCTRCGEEKPVTAFYENRRRLSGVTAWCRECTLAQQAEKYRNDPARREACKVRARHSWHDKYQNDPEFRRQYLDKRKHERAERIKRWKPSVYFVQAGPCIKIGRTINNLADRLNALQVAHYEELIVHGIMDATEDTERLLHERFAHLHVRGEWFRVAPELMTFIKENATDANLPAKKSSPGSVSRQGRRLGQGH